MIKVFNHKKILILIYLFIFQFNCKASTHSIVLVHIGDAIPAYLKTCLKQIRLFNSCDVFLISNEAALRKFEHELEHYHVKGVSCESLIKSPYHLNFLESRHLKAGFWTYATERFFYLDELIRSRNLENVFHMEYDNMLYVDLITLLPHFEKHYAGIAATFDNDNRCIPGFMYIKNGKFSRSLASFLCDGNLHDKNDMESIALYKNLKGAYYIDFLPIITKEYKNKYELISPHRHRAVKPSNYCNNIELFKSVFDAAALGQYLGGIDPCNGPSRPGFINESCIFNSSFLTYEWKVDKLGRKVPYMVFDGKKYRINNLHIHSKRLHEFLS